MVVSSIVKIQRQRSIARFSDRDLGHINADQADPRLTCDPEARPARPTRKVDECLSGTQSQFCYCLLELGKSDEADMVEGLGVIFTGGMQPYAFQRLAS